MWTATAVLALLTSGLAGCGRGSSRDSSEHALEQGPPGSAVKYGDGRVRHDLGPLQKRFPLLSSVRSASWMSGTMHFGKRSAPGPTTYWIDAVVVLPASTVTAWKRSYRTSHDPASSGLLPPLAGEVGYAGGFWQSPQLDDAFSTTSWRSTVQLYPRRGLVVIGAKGQ